MDVNASCQCLSTLLLCCYCGKPGHFEFYCPQGLEVHYLLPAEQEELLMQLLATKDAVGAPSLDTAVLETVSEELVVGNTPSLEVEEDF